MKHPATRRDSQRLPPTAVACSYRLRAVDSLDHQQPADEPFIVQLKNLPKDRQ